MFVHLLLDLPAAAAMPISQHALTFFVDSVCLVKISIRCASMCESSWVAACSMELAVSSALCA